MPQYLVAIHHPDNYDSSAESEAMVRDIDVLNEEMETAKARFFAGGLQSAPHAKSLRKQPGGEVVITDGPYLETKEHIGGFWILDAANMDAAVAWDAKPSSPAAHRSRCASSSQCQQNRNSNPEHGDSNEKAYNHGTHLAGRRDPALLR